jgi:type III secretion system-like peptide-binding chaperone
VSDPVAARAFLLAEVDALEPLDFVIARPVGALFDVVEVTRTEQGALEVRIPGRPRAVPELSEATRIALAQAGFASSDAADAATPWVRAVPDAAAAVDLLQDTLRSVFAQKPDVAIDIAHGSHRVEIEAQHKLEAMRQRIDRVATELLGQRPPQDGDGDYVLALGGVQVIVAPRAVPGGPLVVRVFSITNAGVKVAPELGLFLARLNFSLMFGRFALDTDHNAIWFDETLLGDQFSDDDLRFTIRVVASTADEWDDRIKQMFGGASYQEVLAGHSAQPAPTTKPGQGGYL